MMLSRTDLNAASTTVAERNGQPSRKRNKSKPELPAIYERLPRTWHQHQILAPKPAVSLQLQDLISGLAPLVAAARSSEPELNVELPAIEQDFVDEPLPAGAPGIGRGTLLVGAVCFAGMMTSAVHWQDHPRDQPFCLADYAFWAGVVGSIAHVSLWAVRAGITSPEALGAYFSGGERWELLDPRERRGFQHATIEHGAMAMVTASSVGRHLLPCIGVAEWGGPHHFPLSPAYGAVVWLTQHNGSMGDLRASMMMSAIAFSVVFGVVSMAAVEGWHYRVPQELPLAQTRVIAALIASCNAVFLCVASTAAMLVGENVRCAVLGSSVPRDWNVLATTALAISAGLILVFCVQSGPAALDFLSDSRTHQHLPESVVGFAHFYAALAVGFVCSYVFLEVQDT